MIQFLAWTEGHFSFLHGAAAEGGALSEPTDILILEGCRFLDERSATTLEGWPNDLGLGRRGLTLARTVAPTPPHGANA